MNQFSRTELLLGKDAVEKLRNASVAIFGIGGVGSFAAEALARCGIGELGIFDADRVCITNINRQLIATHKTIGEEKVSVMRDRILDINPEARVEAVSCFYSADNEGSVDLSKYSYIVDAIDTVTSKLLLIQNARRANVPVISSMGAGNKLDPTRLRVADIYETSVCPLAKVMRKELRVRGVDSLKVVYSTEPPLTPGAGEGGCKDCAVQSVCLPDSEAKTPTRRQTPGSVSFVPSVAGLIIAGEVVKDLAGILRVEA